MTVSCETAIGAHRNPPLPPPYKFPKGIETPRTLQNLTARLLERGFSELDIRKIWGLNWMRVYREVWGG